MRLKALLLALLLIAPTASRVAASGQSTPTPDPQPQAKPEPAQPKVREKKKIVVISPEKEIVVDDDGVFTSGVESITQTWSGTPRSRSAIASATLPP